jgi:uncharacterized protein YbcI
MKGATALWVLQVLPELAEQRYTEGSAGRSRMSDQRDAPKSDEQVISAGMVRIYKEMIGRGPTKARTEISDGMVITILADSLTKGELTLSATEHAEKVRELRRTLQSAMREEMTKLVEETLRRKVICLLSDHSPDPDYAVEVLLLEPKA